MNVKARNAECGEYIDFMGKLYLTHQHARGAPLRTLHGSENMATPRMFNFRHLGVVRRMNGKEGNQVGRNTRLTNQSDENIMEKTRFTRTA